MAAVSKVLVVGGGIGGLVAARALRLRGIAVDLIEKQPDWTVYGVGIIQPRNMLRALDTVGLARQCLDAGAAFGNYRIHDAAGTVLIDPPATPGAAAGMPAHNGITRPRLHGVLVEGARAAGADIRLGTVATSFVDRGGHVDVAFSDGEARAYDLVLAFDGALSDTRRVVLGDRRRPTFTGQGVWRYNFERPAGLDTAALFFGPDTKVGLIPLSDTLIYMFVVTVESDGSWFDGPGLAGEMRARLEAYGGLVADLRDRIVDPAGVVYRPMMNLLVEAPWHKGRVLIAGDAAHTTTPHLGQGAAMAVEDAVLLAELLAEDRSLDAIMAEFIERRFARVKYVTDCSQQIAAWELEEWRGIHNAEARPGELLHEANVRLMTEY